MRRCPHCQAPQPDASRYCPFCGQALPAPVREPWLRVDDLWSAAGFRRCALGALPVTAFALSATPWLAGGPARDEGRLLAYHLCHGLLLGVGLAWARRERVGTAWAAWLLAGLAGGLLSEGLDLWFSYRQIFSGVAQWLWQALGLDFRPALVYELLQGLRLLGAALPLALAWAWEEKRLARWLQAPLWLAAALLARSQVRGFFLTWGSVAGFGLSAWSALTLFYGSVLAVFWGLGPRTQNVGSDA